VAEQTIDHRFFGEFPSLAEDGADIGDELRLQPPDGR
jgi:hypothetical protein